jgi:FeS assembly SUF system regulator
MIRITKITDHGVVLLTHFARAPEKTVYNARDLAEREQMSLPMVSKILKILAGSRLLRSHRGVKGGYSLARPAPEITLEEVVTALEGPVALTDCSHEENGGCDREPFCNVSPHWKTINRMILQAMERINLMDLAYPPEQGTCTCEERATDTPAASPVPAVGSRGGDRGDNGALTRKPKKTARADSDPSSAT